MVKVSGSDSVEQTTEKTQAMAEMTSAEVKTAAKSPAKSSSKTAAKTAAKSAKPAKSTAKADKPAKAAKPAKPAPTPAKPETPAPAAVAAEPVVSEPKLVTSTMPVVTGPEMKKKDLVDKVVKRSGVKKKDAKLVVEAMLAVLGEALAEGRELNLQPMGRLKTNRIKATGNGRVLICKLRQGGGEGKGAKEAIAEDDD